MIEVVLDMLPLHLYIFYFVAEQSLLHYSPCPLSRFVSCPSLFPLSFLSLSPFYLSMPLTY